MYNTYVYIYIYDLSTWQGPHHIHVCDIYIYIYIYIYIIYSKICIKRTKYNRKPQGYITYIIACGSRCPFLCNKPRHIRAF